MDLDSYSDKLTKPRSIPHLSFLDLVLRAFSPSERLALYGLTILLCASALALLTGLNAAVSVEVPAEGGTLTEGEIGPARFINPILTLSQPDEDLTALVYSGLTRILPDGSIIPDLASRYNIGDEGTTYTFTIRANATFQDGTPLTAADVLFTVQAAQNPGIKSPRRADWEGVAVSSPDPHTVIFKLPHAYAPFIENTTLGILPKHIWQNVSAEEFPFSPANTHPIGSGPYRVSGVATDNTGSPTHYDLEPFAAYALGRAYLSRITFMFYPNQGDMTKAFNAHQIDAIAGIAPSDLGRLERTGVNVVRTILPRVFGVFLNQSRAPALAELSARAALDASLDKQRIVDVVLGGYGVTLDGPIPPGVPSLAATAIPAPFTHASGTSTTSTINTARAEAARAILSSGGWTFDTGAGVWKKKSASSKGGSSSGGKAGSLPDRQAGASGGKLTLSFTLATGDEPELVQTANAVAAYWRAAGIQVAVKVYPLSELNTSVIRPRAYDAILFGEVVGRTLDLFAFWHSSQRNDPGLNLAMYANAKVDSYLAQARATTDTKQRKKLYAQFTDAIRADQPAVFLYSPEFIYIVPKQLQGVELGALTTPAERFLNVYQWYGDTERVWSIFTNKTN